MLAYTQRYSAPRAHIRRRWMHRIQRSVAEHGQEREPLVHALDAVLDLAERYKFVDDAAFAASRSRRSLARGVAPERVQAQLTAKGVPRMLAAEAVATEGGPNAALHAAAAYARRRRLGIARPLAERAPNRQRDLAALARAGFGYGLALRVLAGEGGPDDPALVEEEE